MIKGFNILSSALRGNEDKDEMLRKALSTFQRGYEAYPKSSTLAYGIAYCFLELGEPNGAKRAAERIEGLSDVSVAEIRESLIVDACKRMGGSTS